MQSVTQVFVVEFNASFNAQNTTLDRRTKRLCNGSCGHASARLQKEHQIVVVQQSLCSTKARKSKVPTNIMMTMEATKDMFRTP